MNKYLYDDGNQEENEEVASIYKTEQEYWEEYDMIHAMKERFIV